MLTANELNLIKESLVKERLATETETERYQQLTKLIDRVMVHDYRINKELTEGHL
jgi:hypothetical protein